MGTGTARVNPLLVFLRELRDDLYDSVKEVLQECFSSTLSTKIKINNNQSLTEKLFSSIYIPYIPSLHSPGWLLRYLVGPFNQSWIERLVGDVVAGLTVAFLLIPQALSYASLANLPPVNGLYTFLLAGPVYALFGSSMQLSVGPVALASLLTGTLVNDFHALPESPESVHVGTQAALCVGAILTLLSLLNLGHLIQYVSRPVMSGFTTGATLTIGLSQMKNAFGFTVAVPQAGQTGYPYNYQVMQWFMQNWHAQTDGHPVINRLAVQFTFAIYIPLLLLKLLQKRLAGKLSKEVKASITWKVIEILVNVSPFLAMVISARVAWQFKTGPHNSLYRVQHLRVVGDVQQGLEFISEPQLPHPFIEFFAACIPVTFVAFMEGYSVAYRIASQKGDLRSLNPNQEIWATGIANFVACISSGYPVAGSFSRSSLNAAAGANTQLSTLVTAAVVTVALGSLAQSFYYIPQASLASIIWVAIFNLVDLHDFWSAWKYSKSDFFLITLTFTLEFLFSTEVALTTGLIASLIVFALQAAFNSNTQPRVQLCAQSNSGIEVIKLESTEFGFLNHPAVQALLSTLYRAESKSSVLSDCSDRAFHSVSSALDQALRPTHASTSNVRAVVLDMSPVRVLDWTALMALHEATQETKSRGISVVFINIHDSECVLGMFQKFGIRNYVIQSDTNEIDKELQRYLSMTAIETRIVSDLEAYTDSVDDKGRGEHDSSGTSVRIEEFDVAADYMEKHS